MWHEARRQERKIRGMLVDYRRRAERRRDFYEKIKADPTQFLQVHGRQCKIHLDPAIAAAADSASAMMPWQNQADNLIDRFDVRAHLDYIPPVQKDDEDDLTFEERQINYERYRIIAQNSFLGTNEEKFLKQLHLEEQFGYTESKSKKETRSGGAAIGFNYEDGTGQMPAVDAQDDDSGGNSDSDLDVDLSVNVSKMDSTQAHEMNKHGRNFGMSSNDFYSFLTNDLEEAESFRLAKEEEHEKALFSGRKSRRERRAHREKRLANRVISPPSYAARTSPTYPSFRESKSASKSPSPENTGKITYITSFGEEEETPSTSKPTYADKLKYGKSKKRNSSPERVVYFSRRGYSKDRSYNHRRKRSRSRDARSRSRTTRRSWSKDRYRKSRSHSKTRNKSYRRKRSSSGSSSSSSSSSSKSRSKSRSKSVDKIRKKSSSSSSTQSNSPADKKPTNKGTSESPVKKESPPKAIPRYYGRKKSDQSSSELSDSSSKDDAEVKPANSPAGSEKWTGYGNSGAVTKKTGQNLTIQERLKRKRQALLNKQFKADKIAEQLKTEREKQEQQNREDELREMALKLRRRQREKRHAYDSKSSNSSDSESSKSRSPPPVVVEVKPKSPSPYVAKQREDYREPKRYERRDESRERRERSRDRRSRSPRSPRRYSEKRVVYRERRDRRDRRDDSDWDRRDKDSHERERRDDRERGGRSLVDY